MSGIEVAGLLLAAPPLIISWLEHYKEVFEVLGCWRRYRGRYRKAQTQLEALELSMDMTFESLFLLHVDDTQELERLKESYRAGTSSELESKLSTRLLPKVSTVHSSLMHDFRDAMQDLTQELGCDKHVPGQLAGSQQDVSLRVSQMSFKEPWDRLRKRTNFERERLRFSTRESQRDAAISKVKALLDQLQSLVVQNDDTVRRRSQQVVGKSKSKLWSALMRFCRHAHTVHGLIHKAWSCPCRSQHYADLQLLPVTSPEVSFDLHFHYDQIVSATASQRWSEKSTRIAPIDLPDPSKQPQSTGRVRFAPTGAVSIPQSSAPDAIDDLCRALSDSQTTPRITGVLVGQGDNEAYAVSLLDQATSPIGHRLVDLATLLQRDLWERPHRKTRYRMAATIASSHLQLHASGWLADGWRKDHILVGPGDGPDTVTLYLRTNFVAPSATPLKPTFDISFATLGIVLLELCFGYTLESTKFWKDITNGSPDPVMERAAAWEWAGLVGQEAGGGYKQAVDWCLNKWNVREDDSTWRQEFQDNVVQPLREEAGLTG